MLFIMIVLFIPLYGLFIWGLYEPEEAMLFMDKWRYKELPEFSELQLKLFRYSNIAGIIILSFTILMTAYVTFFVE